MLVQAETDFKAECMAGDTIESLASRVVEDTNGTGVFRYTRDLPIEDCQPSLVFLIPISKSEKLWSGGSQVVLLAGCRAAERFRKTRGTHKSAAYKSAAESRRKQCSWIVHHWPCKERRLPMYELEGTRGAAMEWQTVVT